MTTPISPVLTSKSPGEIFESKDFSQFSIESKNKVEIALVDLKTRLPQIFDQRKKVILYKPDKAYSKLNRATPSNTLYGNNKYDHFLTNDDPLEYLKNLDENSSFHNTKSSLIKKPIYGTTGMFSNKAVDASLNMSKIQKKYTDINRINGKK